MGKSRFLGENRLRNDNVVEAVRAALKDGLYRTRGPLFGASFLGAAFL
jgi:hypothetical protein